MDKFEAYCKSTLPPPATAQLETAIESAKSSANVNMIEGTKESSARADDEHADTESDTSAAVPTDPSALKPAAGATLSSDATETEARNSSANIPSAADDTASPADATAAPADHTASPAEDTAAPSGVALPSVRRHLGTESHELLRCLAALVCEGALLEVVDIAAEDKALRLALWRLTAATAHPAAMGTLGHSWANNTDDHPSNSNSNSDSKQLAGKMGLMLHCMIFKGTQHLFGHLL